MAQGPDGAARIGSVTESTACAVCGGAGWLLESKDGRKLARPCACRAEAVRAGRLSAAQIPARYQDCNLRNFDERDPWRVQARRRDGRP